MLGFNWSLLTKFFLVCAFAISLSISSTSMAQDDDGGDDGGAAGVGPPAGGILINAEGLLARRALPNLSLIHI